MYIQPTERMVKKSSPSKKPTVTALVMLHHLLIINYRTMQLLPKMPFDPTNDTLHNLDLQPLFQNTRAARRCARLVEPRKVNGDRL